MCKLFNKFLLIAKNAGLKNINVSTQSNFLKMNGINVRAEQLMISNPKFKDKERGFILCLADWCNS